jgi:hypothetical protein
MKQSKEERKELLKQAYAKNAVSIIKMKASEDESSKVWKTFICVEDEVFAVLVSVDGHLDPNNEGMRVRTAITKEAKEKDIALLSLAEVVECGGVNTIRDLHTYKQ